MVSMIHIQSVVCIFFTKIPKKIVRIWKYFRRQEINAKIQSHSERLLLLSYHQIIIKRKFNVIRSSLPSVLQFTESFNFIRAFFPFHFETFRNTFDSDFILHSNFESNHFTASFYFSVNFAAFWPNGATRYRGKMTLFLTCETSVFKCWLVLTFAISIWKVCYFVTGDISGESVINLNFIFSKSAFYATFIFH